MIYIFEDEFANRFALHGGTRDLYHNDKHTKRLTLTECKALLYLIAHQKDVVTYETLFRECWPGHDEYNPDNKRVIQVIKNIRRAIEDSEDNDTETQFIENIRGRGYRFTKSVQTSPEDFDDLLAIASRNCLWTVLATATRGLETRQARHPLGSRIRIAYDFTGSGFADSGNLLLLNVAPEGVIYCLCPSWFARNTEVKRGQHYLPQDDSPEPAFLLEGEPGTEHLVAILTKQPLALDWMPGHEGRPARVLTQADQDTLLCKLRQLPAESWRVWSTSFESFERPY